MKITKVDFDVLVWPELNPPFWMSLLPVNRPHELIIRITTDDGLTGIGHTDQLAGAYQLGPDGAPQLGNAAKFVVDEVQPYLQGKNSDDIQEIWDKLFSLTYRKGWNQNGWTRPQMMAVIAATDMALWDLRAKRSVLPVYKLLGGTDPNVLCYMAGGYYREGKSINHLEREMNVFRKQGFKAIKMRVGGDSLEVDSERVAVSRSALGPDVRLMLDANEAYTADEGIRAAGIFKEHDVFWFEEPARWYEGENVWKRVAEEGGIPVAGGEQAATRWESQHLVNSAAISYMEFDCMRTGGPSEWLKVAEICNAAGIPMAPHHGPLIHAHLVSAVSNGLMVEVFPDPKLYGPKDELEFTRWDRKYEMFSSFPEITDGYLQLPDKAGWGFELDEDAVGRLRIRK